AAAGAGGGGMRRLAVPILSCTSAILAALLCMAYWADMARAHADVVHVYMDDSTLKHVLGNCFPAGSPRRDIEYYLSNTPIWHGGYDPDTKQIEGVIQTPQRLLFVPREPPIQLTLNFRDDERLDSVTFIRGPKGIPVH